MHMIPVEERPVDMTRRSLQTQMLRGLAGVAAQCVTDILQLPPHTHHKVRQALTEFEQEWKHRAKSSANITQPCGFSLDEYQAQYIDQITSNVVGFFLCRRKDCLWIWRSVDWLRHDTWHFDCPTCGHRYRPWSKTKGIHVKANMVWITKASTVSANNAIMKGRNGREYAVTPLTWADTTITALTTKLKEIFNEVHDEITQTSPELQMERLVDMTRKSAPHAILRPYRLSEQILEK